MSDRLSAGFDRLRDLVPEGADVQALHEVVSDDLPEGSVDDLLGGNRAFDPSVAHDTLPRIRPVLVALAARAAGAEQVEGEVLHTAEILHRALLLHDAAFGKQGGKRRWLARKLVKRSVGLLASNHLTLRALELARHTRPEVMGEVVDTLRHFSDGQELLAELQQGVTPTFGDWAEHADAHTGALFAFCCRAGGWLAGADRPKITALGRYGRHLGRLWHVAEDVSSFSHGDPGAHLMARALAARPILAVIRASERDEAIGEDWARLVREPDPDLADELASRVVAAGGLRRAREAMALESWAARRALSTLRDTRYRRSLDKLAAGLARAGNQAVSESGER